GGPISPISIQATNFGLKNDMIQQVQNSCQFHGLPGDDANKHLDKFLQVTQSIKVNGVTADALHLYLFPHSLTHHATAWFDRLPRNLINTFEQMAKMFLGKYFPTSMVTKLRTEITTSVNPPLAKPRTYMMREPIKANNAILKNMQTNMTSLINLNLELKNMFGQFMKMNTASSLGSGTLPGNTITNLKEELKGITTRSVTAYQGPTFPTTSSSLPSVVERETEATKDMVHPTNNERTKDIQPLVVQIESPILNSELVVAPIIEPVAASVSALKPNQRPSIPYPSRLYDQKLCDKANDQRDKFFQILKDLNFNISFIDALILMPKFSPTIKNLLTNKDKLSELARTPLNEHCSTVLLKKLLEKLGDLRKFLIPYFDVDPRVPLIFGRSFLKTERALIDVFEAKSDKSSIDEPPEVELKDLPPYLEYAFLDGDDKLPVIITKDLSVEEKATLITVLKSHKLRTSGQHQRRVNPKIRDVIKNKVLKLLDVGLIYLISDSPWGIVCGHKISKNGIEVDKAKVDVIAKLPHPTTVKGIRSFLGHAGFYRRFIKDFSKIARSMTRLLEKDTSFFFSKECVEAFQTLKRKLTEAPILIYPD
nr:reverse transcriptase domain-containing protein [Tanacetum cinerariifolium]